MVIVYVVYAAALVGLVAGVWALVTGDVTQGLALLVLSLIWALVSRADFQRRQRQDNTR
ncbi:MAG: hypothetical protein QOF21_2884 [Actinomycetota bacterium]|jgi:membrane protein implicated in regulation of membrane protease activity